MSGKMLKQNAVRSKTTKLKCRKFSTLEKPEIKMQRKIHFYSNWSQSSKMFIIIIKIIIIIVIIIIIIIVVVVVVFLQFMDHVHVLLLTLHHTAAESLQ